ncbi:Mfa1 family fimbria major subunit [Parabacteroides sp.]
MNRYKAKEILIALALLLLPACSDEIRLDTGREAEGTDFETYMTLSVSCPQPGSGGVQTRSNPTGGENGDGHEPGQDYETRIDDLMLLFYQGEKGVNSAASTPIDKIIYLDRDAMQGDNRTEPVKVGLPGGWYDLLVITNTGNIRPQLQGKTLGDIRDYLQRQAWTEKEGKYSRFVMSSNGHEDELVYICGENTIDNPACATVEVERHAARIDYQTVGDYYDVNDQTSGKARVEITGAMLINNLNAGSYMLKRVLAADPSTGEYGDASTTEYLGLELPEFGDHQTNYVIDPWSYLKTTGNVNKKVFNPDAPGTGSAPLRDLYENYLTAYGTSTDNWKFPAGLGERVGDWHRVGYTLENAVSKADQSRYINTGVVFKARYAPEKWLVYDSASKTTTETTSADGKPFTFFALGGKLYGSVEAAMLDYAPSGTDLFNYSFAGKSWADVQTLAERIKDNDPVGYKRFLLKQSDSKTLSARLTASEAKALGWAEYIQSTFGYTNADGKITVNQDGKDTRRLLARYDLHTYVDGICYYPYWIRHSNNNASTKGIMEYAIVRNNIYKLRIGEIYGLGYDIPYEPPFDPDDEPFDPDKEPIDPDPEKPDPEDPDPDEPDKPDPGNPDPDEPDKPDPGNPDPDNDPLIDIRVIVKQWSIHDKIEIDM